MACQIVRIGSREIVVDQSPLRVSYLSSGVHAFTLRQSADGQIILQHAPGTRFVGWIFFVLGWPVLLLGLGLMIVVLAGPAWDGLLGALFFLAWGFPFAFFSVKLLGRRCRFSTSTGELTIHHFVRTRRQPLEDILAFQVISAGIFGSNNDDGGERFTSYQLNALLEDHHEQRLFLAFHHDKTEIGKLAQQLAGFLKVPVEMAITTEIPLEVKRASAATESE